jgi:hypothetical protein
VDLQLLESLLYQEESESLDFKVQQYPFAGATEEQKSEFLKDILAFANAWRQTDAYILIGVEEVRGGRSLVHGIDPKDHLLNRNLQQFVHSKTNRPADFWYAPLNFEGADIGVLTIPLQDRPVYLTKPYGKLAPDVVYVRRRDTTGTAAPEEIARMGSTAVLRRAQPVLEVEFANLLVREKFGTSVVVKSRVLEIPDRHTIPLYGSPPSEGPYGMPLDLSGSLLNRDYYRDLADYLRETSLVCALGVAVTNSSPTAAEEVWVTLELDTAADMVVLDESDIPSKPSTDRIAAIRPAMFQGERRVCVDRYDKYEVRVQIGTVQPGTTQWSHEPFYIGARRPMEAVARIQVSANNLRAPIAFDAGIDIEVERVSVSLDDITGSRKTGSK